MLSALSNSSDGWIPPRWYQSNRKERSLYPDRWCAATKSSLTPTGTGSHEQTLGRGNRRSFLPCLAIKGNDNWLLFLFVCWLFWSIHISKVIYSFSEAMEKWKRLPGCCTRPFKILFLSVKMVYGYSGYGYSPLQGLSCLPFTRITMRLYVSLLENRT